MRTLIYRLNYSYIVYVLLREPLKNTILPFDQAGRIVVLLSILLFLLNLINDRQFQRLFVSKPIIIWGIWVVYSVINLSIKGYHEEVNAAQPFPFYVIQDLFTPFLIMLLTALEFQYAPKKLLYLLLVTFTIYGVFAFFLRDSTTGISLVRNKGLLGNAGALNTLFIIFYCGLLLAYGWLKQFKVITLILFAFSVIILIATRKAFAAGIIMLAFIILSQINLTPKKIALVTTISLSIILGANFILKNTIIGKRFATIEETGAKDNTTDNQFLNYLGDRAPQYIKGWDIFLKNPITGIGLNNFRIVSHYNWRLHSEYMVQITEGGIIGSLIFLFFNTFIFLNIIKCWSKYPHLRDVLFVLTGGFIAILFLNLTAWTFAFPRYFACFGVIIGHLKIIKINEDSNT